MELRVRLNVRVKVKNTVEVKVRSLQCLAVMVWAPCAHACACPPARRLAVRRKAVIVVRLMGLSLGGRTHIGTRHHPDHPTVRVTATALWYGNMYNPTVVVDVCDFTATGWFQCSCGGVRVRVRVRFRVRSPPIARVCVKASLCEG